MKADTEGRLRASYGFLASPAVALDPARPAASRAATGGNTRADWEEHLESLLQAAVPDAASKATEQSLQAIGELEALAAQFVHVRRLDDACQALRSAAFERVADSATSGGDPAAVRGAPVAVVLPPRPLPRKHGH